MKTKLLLVLLILLSSPQPSKATSGCLIEDGACYDLDLDIEVGDELIWNLTEYLINGNQVDYGEAPDKPLTVTMEVISDFRGLYISHVYDDPSLFFSIEYTVDGELSHFQPDNSTWKYKKELPWSNRVIQPTLIANDSSVSNRFDQLIQPEEVSVWEYAEETSNTTTQAEIIDNTYIFHRHIVNTRLNDSVVVSQRWMESKWNIHNGLLEQETEQLIRYVEGNIRNFSYHFELISPLYTAPVTIATFGNGIQKILDRSSVILVLAVTSGILVIGLLTTKMKSRSSPKILQEKQEL